MDKSKKKGRPKGEGYIFQGEEGRLIARLTYTDESGKRRNLKKYVANRTEGNNVLKLWRSERDDSGTRGLQAYAMTFDDLADYYEKHYLRKAEYVDGRKIAGLRSLATPLSQLKVLRDYLGRKRLRSITHGDLRLFRATRLQTPTRSDKQRSIASVNRELALLRRMLNVAQREGWILRNPLHSGDSLISIADEHKRERIISLEEEARLLVACARPKRTHLRAIIIAALDTGMRKGELLKLRWSDVDFDASIINVRAFNTKTMRERQLGMTARLKAEFQQLYEQSTQEVEGSVFGIQDDVKKSFASARKEAGLEDVRFHDLRHTHATRLVAHHIPLSEVGRVLGHTQANTTYRYVNANLETARRAAAVLDALYTPTQTIDTSEVVH
ncbi:MAG TPA: site-specific integrase [Pyrinomonadaceae bacterium]|nr:site-specific integrase [Pyrinomonadaceae bacterium]